MLELRAEAVESIHPARSATDRLGALCSYADVPGLLCGVVSRQSPVPMFCVDFAEGCGAGTCGMVEPLCGPSAADSSCWGPSDLACSALPHVACVCDIFSCEHCSCMAVLCTPLAHAAGEQQAL